MSRLEEFVQLCALSDLFLQVETAQKQLREAQEGAFAAKNAHRTSLTAVEVARDGV